MTKQIKEILWTETGSMKLSLDWARMMKAETNIRDEDKITKMAKTMTKNQNITEAI